MSEVAGGVAEVESAGQPVGAAVGGAAEGADGLGVGQPAQGWAEGPAAESGQDHHAGLEGQLFPSDLAVGKLVDLVGDRYDGGDQQDRPDDQCEGAAEEDRDDAEDGGDVLAQLDEAVPGGEGRLQVVADFLVPAAVFQAAAVQGVV